MNSLRVLTCGILLSAGLAFLGGCGKKAPEQPAPAAEATPPPVPEDPSATRIGLILPLSGAQASFGTDAIKGAQLAEAEINAAGGVLGHPIKLIVRDSQSDTEATVATVTELAEKENAVALIGEIASDRTLAAAPVAQKLGIPLITPGATHAGVTAAGDYIFRVCYTDAAQAVAMAKFARSIDVTKAAVLYDRRIPIARTSRPSSRRTSPSTEARSSRKQRISPASPISPPASANQSCLAGNHLSPVLLPRGRHGHH